MLQKAFDFASVLGTFPLRKLPFHSKKSHDMIKLNNNPWIHQIFLHHRTIVINKLVAHQI